ncbi:response regulator transcription factor [Polymorphum gilvum]|uniref:Two component transcriptional regulator, winged helix family n=1 Tax=Polymorphum gilvum (strain LMG 25793 / CGMCC 1.9160 / SL003B-26A1) TaxID=991905 RepID=F2J3Z0_POLGS|nr:response regulator transcription factor [Polymorphum gilvum]ADZ68972.1 Two component transcriptional regulator, winged helix family [Polymorphum gilvum SL003B-26A1]
MRIALVEDNRNLCRGIENALLDQGHAVDVLNNGEDADRFLATQGADLAIVDVNLPGMSGLQVVRNLRLRKSAMPVLILTARGDTGDKVAGLDAGADDYLVKPFDMAELLARIRALSRRRQTLKPVEEVIGSLTYNRAARKLCGTRGTLDLPRREMALFECLLDNAGRVVTKETIAETLYGSGSDIEPNAVELLVSRLRRKLHDTGVEIRTARGLGYLLDDSRA